MTKAEELLKNAEVESNEEFYVNTTDVLWAMEEQSIAFDKWKTNEHINVAFFDNDDPIYYYKGQNYTSKELYKLFNEL